MSIKVRFFASLAETIGRREADCPHERGLTVGRVWKRYSAGADLPGTVLCAVNHTYCDLEQELADDDEVAYFPPVTGG